ncbi:MAG: TatD family hydrolase [Bacteroidetes bacterium]|nr:TatD family hydrolase [Bacteroidota bacterium]MBS1628699.1 TatD family hydrolase [Bacteroidota bacterium]
MFIDTHTHLYDDRLDARQQDEMIHRAFDAGVAKLYMPNCDLQSIPGMMRIANTFPGQCFPMMGLHPTYVNEHFLEELKLVQHWLGRDRFAAVGEIGLDYYWDKTFIKQQKEAFTQQIDWALEHDLPIVIHSREATDDCIEIVRSKQNGQLRGIFHCFSGNMEQAQQVVDLQFLLGIGGTVTYKSNRVLAEVVQQVPIESLVLETDAPYLAPVPFRGKRNESSFIRFVAEKLSELRGISLDELARVTSANADKLFSKKAMGNP